VRVVAVLGPDQSLTLSTPASGARLENAARSIALNPDSQPIVIADYGSSQGKNSLLPMRVAIEVLQARLGSDRPVLVYHEDLPANDCNSLFEVLDKDPQSYVLNAPNIFPCAIGRSFYEIVLPPNHVHLGWCSYAAMWISRIPTRIPGHFVVPRSTGEVRAAFERQGAQDWERFLALRARELRPGGRLVIVVVAANDDGISGLEDLMDHANATLTEMVDEGAITADERAPMVIGAWPRRRRDLLAPFAGDRQFCDLKVEHCQTNVVADAAWAAYEQDGNKEALATRHALFVRTTFAPTLAGALAHNSDAERSRAFSDRLESGRRSKRRSRSSRSSARRWSQSRADPAEQPEVGAPE
jgi:SAM dependent carboxyl methyltransferase